MVPLRSGLTLERCLLINLDRVVTILNAKDDVRFEHVADFVIAARGTLNDVFWPEIPGLKTFQGKLMHSAEWDTRSVNRCHFWSQAQEWCGSNATIVAMTARKNGSAL
jgi:hypothetical protein